MVARESVDDESDDFEIDDDPQPSKKRLGPASERRGARGNNAKKRRNHSHRRFGTFSVSPSDIGSDDGSNDSEESLMSIERTRSKPSLMSMGTDTGYTIYCCFRGTVFGGFQFSVTWVLVTWVLKTLGPYKYTIVSVLHNHCFPLWYTAQ